MSIPVCFGQHFKHLHLSYDTLNFNTIFQKILARYFLFFSQLSVPGVLKGDFGVPVIFRNALIPAVRFLRDSRKTVLALLSLIYSEIMKTSGI